MRSDVPRLEVSVKSIDEGSWQASDQEGVTGPGKEAMKRSVARNRVDVEARPACCVAYVDSGEGFSGVALCCD